MNCSVQQLNVYPLHLDPDGLRLRVSFERSLTTLEQHY